MDTSFLGSEEPVILTVDKIIIGGIRHEAVLTDKRVLLAGESGTMARDIPFTSIGMASAGINKLREPVLSITFTVPAGASVSLEMIFAGRFGAVKSRERDRFSEILAAHGVPLSGDRIAAPETPVRLTAQEWSPSPYQRKALQPAPIAPEGRPTIITVTAVVIIFAVIIGIAFVYQPFSQTKSTLSPPATPSPAVQPPPESTTATQSSGEPALSSSPSGSQASADTEIPGKGVWIRVRYPGNYTGNVGVNGYGLEINATGTQFFQLPVRSGMIEGSVTKKDTSSATLEVALFSDSTPFFARNTTLPAGLIDFHVPLPLPGEIVLPTQAPVTTAPTPPVLSVSMPAAIIPSSGIWVRINYAGNYTGSIGSRGMSTIINSTGDQFYQISIRSGVIEGMIQKEDGSGDPIAVAVYRDGSLVSQLFTVTPHGIVDVHVPV
jgi:hypothetical protein